MPPNAPLFASPILPTREQLALAIAILNTKPHHISIRDYVVLLRSNCKNGRPGRTAEEVDHYLDLVGYWKDECQKAQDECKRLQSVNVRLERSNQMLSHRTSATPDDRPSTTTMSPKRKAAALPSRAPKRARAMPVDKSVAQTQEENEEDFHFLEILGDVGNDLMEAMFTTYELCRATTRNAEVMCRQLVRTASSIGKLIRFIARNHARLSRHGRSTSGPRSLEDDKTFFAQSLVVCSRAFVAVLVGVERMMERSDDDRLPSVVVAALADMANTIFYAIESSARDTAEIATSTPPSLSKKSKAKATDLSAPKESVPARSLAHFLNSILGLLEKVDPIHQKIFDGVVFLLLNRVARHLHYCTFGRYRSASIEDGLIPIPEPITDDEKAKRETDALAIRLEVKALILILERAMGLAPHHMNPATAKAAKSSPSDRLKRTISMKTLPAAPKGRLSGIAKDRLQRTLVTCMYGSKGDDEFLDVLTKPVPAMRVGNLQNVAKVQDENVQQWYKEQVWNLVGWDIMARESGL